MWVLTCRDSIMSPSSPSRVAAGTSGTLAAPVDGVKVIVTPVDPERRVPGFESWWDVPVAEVSGQDSVQRARAAYERARQLVRVP